MLFQPQALPEGQPTRSQAQRLLQPPTPQALLKPLALLEWQPKLVQPPAR